MFSQTAEYALRACVFMSMHPSQAYTTIQISETTQVPAPYLSKVLQALAKAGLVHSQRGIKGGFVLAKDPAKLTILEVINAVDPICRIKTCPLGLKAHGTDLCPLHRKLDDATREIEQAFSSTTLKQLICPSIPLCDFPGPKSVTNCDYQNP